MNIRITDYGFAVTDESGTLIEFYTFLCSDVIWEVMYE